VCRFVQRLRDPLIDGRLDGLPAANRQPHPTFQILEALLVVGAGIGKGLYFAAISRWIAAGIDEATVARMAGDTIETIHKHYLHEFERARRAEEIRAKLVAGTSIQLA
jgi:hypothetical protein